MCLSLNKISTALIMAVLLLPLSAQSVGFDGYAAVVGDQLITVGEVKEDMQRNNRGLFMAIQVGEKVSDAELAEVYQRSLDDLVADALIIEEYQRLKEDGQVEIPEDAVDGTVQNIIRDRYNNSRSDFFKDLERSDLTFEDFKDQQRRNIIITVMRNNHFSGPAMVPPGAVRKLYEERADQYRKPAEVEIALISVSKQADEEQPAPADRVQSLLKEIEAGAEFADVARGGSDGSKAEQGGYRGWMRSRDLRREIRAELPRMQPGDVSGVIDSGDNFYIVQLIDRRPARTVAFAEVEEELTAELRRAADQKRMRAWVDELKKKHYVKEYPLQ